MKAKLPFLFASALALAACGGAAEEGATEPASAEPASAEPASAEPAAADPEAGEEDAHAEPAAHGPEKHEDHHHAFPGEMKTFHDLLAPLWHAEKGEKRAEDTCAALDDLLASAAEVKADVPEGLDESAWTEGADGLTAALEELQASCPAEDLDAFQEKFAAVHDAFHVLVKLVGEAG